MRRLFRFPGRGAYGVGGGHDPVYHGKAGAPDLELQPDADGEMREIAVDAVMELDIRLYEEERGGAFERPLCVGPGISDPGDSTACFDTLAVRNQVRTKIQEKIQLTGRQRILQMCHADGDVKIDEVQIQGGRDSTCGRELWRVSWLLYLTAE